MPKWLVYAIVTFTIWGTWGFVTALAGKAGVPALGNLVLFTIGLVPAAVVAALSPGVRVGADKRRGLLWGFATGVAGGLGNIAYYRAAELGKAAVVYPLTGIYPLVTLLVAWLLMRERLNACRPPAWGSQWRRCSLRAPRPRRGPTPPLSPRRCARRGWDSR